MKTYYFAEIKNVKIDGFFKENGIDDNFSFLIDDSKDSFIYDLYHPDIYEFSNISYVIYTVIPMFSKIPLEDLIEKILNGEYYIIKHDSRRNRYSIVDNKYIINIINEYKKLFVGISEVLEDIEQNTNYNCYVEPISTMFTEEEITIPIINVNSIKDEKEQSLYDESKNERDFAYITGEIETKNFLIVNVYERKCFSILAYFVDSEDNMEKSIVYDIYFDNKKGIEYDKRNMEVVKEKD